MSSKNPFEIRLELLKMAKDIIDEQQARHDNMWMAALAKMGQTNQEVNDYVKAYTDELKQVTSETVIEQATKLAQFIKR